MRCRELRTLFGFKLPADLAQAFIAACGSAGSQDAFHEVRAADAGSTGSLSSLRVSASACWYLCHVDAASGGFIAPFIHQQVVWDFRLPRVKSINVSGHKYGLAPLGCGWAIWREAQDLPEELIFKVKYLGSI
jgi:hypothetical protein